MDKKIFSGVQPTGNLHLGNYLGAIKNFVELGNDNDNECIFCVVDLHAITVKHDPNDLRDNVRETVASFVACGIDPKKNIIFNQSKVKAHSETAWILSCTARMGWLNRMTQFKEKAGKDKEKASVGLYSYPVLMAQTYFFMIQHMYQLEMIKNNIWSFVEILHKNLIMTLMSKIFLKYLNL